MNELTEIQKFYDGKTVFITGGTGLVGKCLVEKLLRSCSVKSIILILRQRNKISYERRVAEYFSDELFTNIKHENSNKLKKVMFVNGNVTLANFGLNAVDYKLIIERTNVVFHSAATVKFVAPLHEAVPLNVTATKNMIAMVREMKNIQAFVYVSTAFVFFNKDKIDETVHEPLWTPEFLAELVNNMTQEDLDRITPTLLGNLVNTYVLTKQAAECLIRREQKHLPVAICRPAIISQSYREPIPGWATYFSAAGRVPVLLAKGAIKILNFSKDVRLDIVPIDMVVNCMIAVAWNTAVHRETELKAYTYFTEDNAITREAYFNFFVKNRYPVKNAFRNPGYMLVSVPWLYRLCTPFVITMPNIILDMVFRIFGKNMSIQDKNKKINIMMDSFQYFLTRNFHFVAKNIPALWNRLEKEDQKLFNFDTQSISWNDYETICQRGIKEIILKDDLQDLDKVKLEHKLLYYLEYLLISLCLLPLIIFLYLMYSFIC